MSPFSSESIARRGSRRLLAAVCSVLVTLSVTSVAAQAAPAVDGLSDLQSDIQDVAKALKEVSKTFDIVIGQPEAPKRDSASVKKPAPKTDNQPAKKQNDVQKEEKKPGEAPVPQTTYREAFPKDQANFQACPGYAEACVDLPNQSAWLQSNGQVTYGPVDISSGKPGQETPSGNHRVAYKVKDEVSRLYNNAPMPYSVYFTNNGHALHEGDPNVMSNGCVHLGGSDAQFFFNHLNVGDDIFIIG